MAKSRLETLEEFARQNPADSFANYGLAMEYAQAGRSEEALQTFEKLLSVNPDYVAVYYHAGVLLGKRNRTAEARSMFQHGIEAATRAQDSHTRAELEEALHNLGD